MKSSPLRNYDAVSPVLGAILILAIGITILTNVQLNFVPVWNAQEELNHLNKMQDDFKELKSGIESSVQSGTTLSVPLSMGFKYSPKMFVYNPRESAYASLDIQNNTWAEIRYNEMSPEGMDDDTSIKNISTSTISYVLMGAQNYRSFIYEHGIIRRNNSNYTANSQTVLANGTIYLLSVKPLGSETTTGMEKRTVSIYPTSQQKNSVLGKKIWLTLHTKPEYVSWWKATLEKEGGDVNKADSISGTLITYIDAAVIKMGEAYISTAPNTAPAHAPPHRVVKITPENTHLPVDGITDLVVEVQDNYNNPVPNIQVNFNINYSRKPSNANATATLLQNQAISGADGRASITLKTSGAGFYYIDASISGYTATFAYPASSQGNVMNLYKVQSGQDYLITANLTDTFGSGLDGKSIAFDTSDGAVNPQRVVTAGGNASTILNVTGATGIKLTNINSSSTTTNSTVITWDAIDNIIVSAQSGYVFNSIEVHTLVNSTGCVRYGTSPGNYSSLACDTNGTVSSHSVDLGGLSSSTAYYFKVNSSRGAVNVISTEYMFVTGAPRDTTPPASITNISYTSGPLYINWTWTDPADADFHHVELYIDSNPSITVPKGQGYYSAFYFRPNSTHTIYVRTVDTSENANATWVNNTAYIPSVFTYVFNYSITVGDVANFDSAKSGSDGGASALFNESLISGMSATENWTYISSNITTNGSISNWTNMQTDLDGGAYANLTEGSTTSGGGTSNYVSNSNFGGTNSGWAESEVDARGYMNEAYDGVVGNTAAGGSGIGSERFTYVDTSGSQPAAGTIEYARINSTSFTAPSGITAISWKFAWQATVVTIGNAMYTVTYNILDSATLAKVSEVHNSTALNTNSTWAFYNGNIPAATLTPGNLYNMQVELKILADRPNRPNITFRTDDAFLNITTSGTTTYRMNLTTYTDPVPTDTDHYLELRFRIDSNETGYDVYVFNGTDWNNRGSLTSNAWTTFNITLSNQEYNSGNVSVRYLDQNPSGTSRGNLSIDYQRVHGYTPGIPAGYNLDVITNTTDIPQSNYSELQIKYNLTGDNFTLEIWNETAGTWSYKTTLNGSGIRYYNYTFSPDELLANDAFTGGTVGDLPKFYARVRYQDEDPAKQGRLYIDYQRVYSS